MTYRRKPQKNPPKIQKKNVKNKKKKWRFWCLSFCVCPSGSLRCGENSVTTFQKSGGSCKTRDSCAPCTAAHVCLSGLEFSLGIGRLILDENLNRVLPLPPSVFSFLYLLDVLYNFHWDLLLWFLCFFLNVHLVHNILCINMCYRSRSAEWFETTKTLYDPQHHSWSHQHLVTLGACGWTGKLFFKGREKCLIKSNTFDLFNYF